MLPNFIICLKDFDDSDHHIDLYPPVNHTYLPIRFDSINFKMLYFALWIWNAYV